MRIYYQGYDITGMVQPSKCIVRDASGNRCDSLDITFENPAGWERWSPAEDDQILIEQDGYNSGVLFLHSVLPENGKYRLFATSLPCAARGAAYGTFSGMALEDIALSCAASSGMSGADFYGIDKAVVIPYIQRGMEAGAAFLDRLFTLEGAVLKCVNGRYKAIGIAYAQELPVAATFEVGTKAEAVRHEKSGTRLKSLAVENGGIRAEAVDPNVPQGHASITISGMLPASDPVQAGRWARGKLVKVNRECELLEIRTEYNPRITAMTHVQITGTTSASGDWLVEEAIHDLIDGKTTIRMRPCIQGIL